jgi:CheY-like chemotaxis protein/anti-sigma regulatory factor (Ser/Thr protein kinase)
MLQDPRLGAAHSLHAIEVIRRNSRVQVQMIDDLLDISRITNGKLRLVPEPVDLQTTVLATIDSLRPAAEARRISLQLHLDCPLRHVSGDPDRLQQVTQNLISNAIKFTPQGGCVTVSLKNNESQIELIIGDTGIGITADFLPHVFDRFRQADASTTRAFGGLGLGLSIVRNLIELHGGSVRVESEGENRGATFTVTLPLLSAPDAQSDTEGWQPLKLKLPSYECASEIEGLRVLVVDDEEDTRDLLQFILESCGTYVKTTSSAADALEAVAEETFDVLISDIGMPDEDGYSLIAKVHALAKERGGKVPAAAALTAYTGEEDRIRVLKSGFQIHVPKPISPDELVSVVANLVRRAH